MARDSVIQVRVDQELKRQAEELFDDMGLDTTSAIRLFLKQSVIRECLPFSIKRYSKKKKKYREDQESQTSTNDTVVEEEEQSPIINDLY